jgi:(1->4)-alpha-D-glucan 1-alpha-D-glucosylmutase
MRRVLLLDPPYYAQDHKAEWLRFVMLWQQFTGPVMAKGLEDTAFYAHNSLISRNEVGGDPLREDPPMDVEAFHQFNQERLKQFPHSLNASSTHDSKRSEDVRARVNVLSELPQRWGTCLDTWMQLNQSHKATIRGGSIPDPQQEILIYQTLLGAWPTDSSDLPAFPDRVKEFMVKAAREAKVHSSWLAPDAEHEEALRNFIDQILSPSHESFLSSFQDFQKEIAFHGTFNALAQVLLKITAPGVPDFYQGTEIWNLSLVDPDNRRPVNYALRTSLLETLKRREAEDQAALLNELVEHWEQPGIKLYLTYKALEFRRSNPDLFQTGDYLPLPAEGCGKQHVCAFARRCGDRWAVTAVPRLTTGLQCRPPDLRSTDWRDTVLLLPDAAPARWRDVLTGAVIQVAPGVALQSLLGAFPVSLLEALP